MTDHIECIVVGAGVVGLAIARALARAGREVIVLEREAAIGTQTSARNSEVVHAGIHYAKGSLKARLCREGRDRLYAYCSERGVNVSRLGKLVVACGETELPLLDDVRAHAEDNDVRDLERLSAGEAMALEPELHCAGALLSPSTGIVDSHGYMLALQGDAEAAGATFAFHAPAVRISARDGGFLVETAGADATTLSCACLVNAAGHDAPALARTLPGDTRVPNAFFCKGTYFTLRGRAPFSRLVYPVPRSDAAGLGVHITLDLGGQAKFGPDIEWVDTMNFDVDSARATAFYPAIRRYWPGLPDGALEPGYTGIRPKISPPGMPPADFRIDGAPVHGIPGLVNLFGIESPGLTSSLAIADHVVGMLPR